MLNFALTCTLLSIALGLSLRRFLLPYMPNQSIRDVTTPATIVANAVFLGAAALALSDQDIWRICLVMLLGAGLACVFDDARSTVAILLATVSLGLYIGLRSL
jgi:hypothetical protein